MNTFIVETYLSRHAAGEPDRTIARTITAIAEMDDLGHSIHYIRAIYLPDDEICLFVLQAESVEAVGVAVDRAGLDPDRIAVADSREMAAGAEVRPMPWR